MNLTPALDAPRSATPPRRRSRGLTLLEIAIGLAVIALLSAVALPSLGARLDHQRLLTAAQALAGDITEARFESVRRGQALQVHAVEGKTWCWTVSAAAASDCNSPNPAHLHTVRTADHPGVRILEGRSVLLQPNGGAQGSVAATLESARGDRLRVEVSMVGRPRVCAVSGKWPNLPAC